MQLLNLRFNSAAETYFEVLSDATWARNTAAHIENEHTQTIDPVDDQRHYFFNLLIQTVREKYIML